MERRCFVSVSIRGVEAATASRDVELGEFHAVWRDGISIGSDPSCTLVLSELRPVEALLVGASNHRLLYRLPEGTSLPVSKPLGRYDVRVDYREFQVGPYLIRVSETDHET